MKSPDPYSLSCKVLEDCAFRRVWSIFSDEWWVQSWAHVSKLELSLSQVFLSDNAVISVIQWVRFVFLTPDSFSAFSESSHCCCWVYQSQEIQQFSSMSCFTGARCAEVFTENLMVKSTVSIGLVRVEALVQSDKSPQQGGFSLHWWGSLQVTVIL